MVNKYILEKKLRYKWRRSRWKFKPLDPSKRSLEIYQIYHLKEPSIATSDPVPSAFRAPPSPTHNRAPTPPPSSETSRQLREHGHIAYSRDVFGAGPTRYTSTRKRKGLRNIPHAASSSTVVEGHDIIPDMPISTDDGVSGSEHTLAVSTRQPRGGPRVEPSITPVEPTITYNVIYHSRPSSLVPSPAHSPGPPPLSPSPETTGQLGLKNLVLVKFKYGVVVEGIIKGMKRMVSEVESIKSFEWGEDTDTDEMLRQGFTHVFSMTFCSAEDIAVYQNHSSQVEFSTTFSAAIEKRLLFNFPARII